MPRKVTTTDFISKAKLIHGDKYDYSKVKYVNCKQKVCIICPIHGEFWQQANEHLRLNGCQKCSYDAMSIKMKKDNLGYINNSPREDKAFIHIWQRMFLRCYNPYYLKRNPTYNGCNVCEEWKDSIKFVEWCKSEKSGYSEGFALDKDILVKGNKIYSPQTCRFVPKFINGLFSTHKRNRGECPIGVRKTKAGTYQSLLTEYGKSKCLGTFLTIEEAFSKYKEEKEKYLKEVAEHFFQKGELCFDIYNALINNEVEITD